MYKRKIDVDRLLATCVSRGCDEGWLVPGHPAFIKHEERVQPLDTVPLDTALARQIADSLIPDSLREWFSENGYVRVFHPFQGGHFEVTIFRVGVGCLLQFRRKSNG